MNRDSHPTESTGHAPINTVAIVSGTTAGDQIPLAAIAQALVTAIAAEFPALTEQPVGPLLTPPEAAKRLAISESKLWKLTEAGDIPRVSVGRSVRYDPRDVEALVERQKETR